MSVKDWEGISYLNVHENQVEILLLLHALFDDLECLLTIFGDRYIYNYLTHPNDGTSDGRNIP